MKRRLPAPWLLAAAVLLGLLLGSPGVSEAQRRWLKLDRVEAQPSWVKGMVKLRAYVTAINVYGGVVPIGGREGWKLQVGSSPLRNHAYALPYSTQADNEVLLVGMVIQTSAESPLDSSQPHSLTEIKPAAIHFIEALPKTARIALATYDEQVHGGKRLESLSTATLTIRKLTPSKTPAAALAKAVRRVIKAINRYRPKGANKDLRVRKLVVVIGDGRDSRWPDPKGPAYIGAVEEAKKLGKLADKNRIRIHTIGYSEENWRQPMLLLGDLSKRSHGTFRLAQSYDSFEVLLRGLQNEIRRQQVLTFYVPEKRVKGRKLRIVAGGIESNEIRLGKIKCGTKVCESDEYCGTDCVPRNITGGTGLVTYALYIGGGIVGLFGVLFVVGFAMSKLGATRAVAPGQDGPEPAPAPPEPTGGGGQTIQPQPNPYAQQQPGAPAPGEPAAAGHQPIQPQANPYAQQQAQQPARAPRRPAPQRGSGSPNLLVIKGDQQGQQFDLHHNFRIGKGAHCDLVLATDGYASTDHAYIQMDRAGNCTLVDNHSTNGTFINGVRVVGQKRLTTGMLIRIGATELRFLTQ